MPDARSLMEEIGRDLESVEREIRSHAYATQRLIHILSTFPQLSTHPELHELTRLRGC